MRQLAFFRDFRGFSGGHLKVWHYFLHTKHSEVFQPTIYLTEDSLRDASNPWVANGEKISKFWQPGEADAVFVAGLDWEAVPVGFDKPVINLIQHVRHANPADPRSAFLGRKATRICVSQQVADKISSNGRTNGPIVTIPAGLNSAELPEPAATRDIPVLIAGYKEPSLAESIANLLRSSGIATHLLTDQRPRAEYLSMVARASVTAFLPNRDANEGFYLPALEGMALGTLVVCPDCLGNRDFCMPGKTCLQPAYDAVSIAVACRDALAGIADASTQRIISAGIREARTHTLARERRAFLEVLRSIAAPENCLSLQ